MNLERYECTADSQFSSFTFDSIGPNGTIRKVINYEQIPGIFLPDGSAVRNLAFGDWNEVEERIDDGIVSNNNDRDKVLATVASTIISFTEKHGKIPVYAEGSSPAKTRLYQMGINAHLDTIKSLFWIYGRIEGEWEVFESGVNFEAFLVIRK